MRKKIWLVLLLALLLAPSLAGAAGDEVSTSTVSQQLLDQQKQAVLQQQAMAAEQAAQVQKVGWVVLGILIIWLSVAVLNLLNVYHWGNTEEKFFASRRFNKKFWFINLILVPQLAFIFLVLAFEPLKYYLFGLAYIYWAIIVLYYFFWEKFKINQGKK